MRGHIEAEEIGRRSSLFASVTAHLLELGVRNPSGHSDLEHLARLKDAEALKLVHNIPGSSERRKRGIASLRATARTISNN